MFYFLVLRLLGIHALRGLGWAWQELGPTGRPVYAAGRLTSATLLARSAIPENNTNTYLARRARHVRRGPDQEGPCRIQQLSPRGIFQGSDSTHARLRHGALYECSPPVHGALRGDGFHVSLCPGKLGRLQPS